MLRRLEIVMEYLNGGKKSTFEAAARKVICKHQESNNHLKTLKDSDMSNLRNQFRIRWKKCHRDRKTFMAKYKTWLESEVKLQPEPDTYIPADSDTSNDEDSFCNASNNTEVPTQLGRPCVSFSSASIRTKRRKTQHLRNHNSAEELGYATTLKLRETGRISAAKVCEQAIYEPTRAATEMLESIEKPKEVVFTPTEALNVIVNTNLSKSSYQFLRQFHMEKNCYMYPPYEQVLAEKTKCYPSDIKVNEFDIEIPLQGLLDHTTSRLVTSLKSVSNFDTIITLKNRGDASHGEAHMQQGTNENDKVHLQLLTKVGIDGSADQSVYNIKYNSGGNVCESSILATFICPMRLTLCKNGNDTLIWQNPVPSSSIYCRPLKLQFKKETAELTRSEIKDLTDAVTRLCPTECDSYVIHHKIILTMVDGKVCQALTNTPSAASCYLCIPKTNPSSMNNLQEFLQKSVSVEALQFGLSPLHLLINSMECILHIGYRMTLKTWMVKGPESKKIYCEEKKRIQCELKSQLGLNVDQPTHGSGNTNTGNIARRFFSDPEVVSKITKVDQTLIYRLSVILVALNSGHEIDTVKYKQYAMETATKYIELYDWYYMPVSMHKMLIHGHQIIDALCIPPGQASEEALEATHKIVRNARQSHTCKTSRIRSNTDLAKWLLLISDPVLASMRKQTYKNNHQSFPKEVMSLLKAPNVA